MFEWKLFMPDEPETYPELKCPLIIADFRGYLKQPVTAALTQRKDGSYWWQGAYIAEAVRPMLWSPLPSIPKDPKIVEVKKCGGDGSCE